jgi:branched-chain amino acid transport system permease protein
MADLEKRSAFALRTLDGLGLAGAIILLLILPSSDAHTLSLATSWLILAALAYGLDLVYAATRHMSLVHAALWGVAAYVMLGMQAHRHWTFWQGVPAAVLGCTIAAAVIALVAYRLNGLYFSILTFVVGEIIILCFTNLHSLTGGASGTFGLFRPTVFGFDVTPPKRFFYFTAGMVAVVILYVKAVRRSRLGRMAMAIGDNEDQARAVGVRTGTVKRWIFILSAVPTGLAGVYYGTFSGAIQPGQFGGDVGIALILITLLGGSGYVAGPLIGAAVYTFVPDWLPVEHEVSSGLVGLVFIVLIRIAPQGIWPALRDLAVGIATGSPLAALTKRLRARKESPVAVDEPPNALISDDAAEGERVL